MKDTTMPDGRWVFDQSVTDAFEDMLRRSIPQYDVMRRACFDLASRFRLPSTDIVDLGCSRGEAIAELVETFGAENRFVGVEVSEPMLAAARSRYESEIRVGTVRIENLDLRTGYPECTASVTLAVLTLQFIATEYRQRVVRDAYRRTVDGGVFIMVEKVLGEDSDINQAMEEAYYVLKAANGYTQEAIQRKRMSLEGVLVPVTANWNEQLLRSAGFSRIDCFWRWMNFAGWIAIR